MFASAASEEGLTSNLRLLECPLTPVVRVGLQMTDFALSNIYCREASGWIDGKLEHSARICWVSADDSCEEPGRAWKSLVNGRASPDQWQPASGHPCLITHGVHHLWYGVPGGSSPEDRVGRSLCTN